MADAEQIDRWRERGKQLFRESSSTDWLALFASELEKSQLPQAQVRVIATDLAWFARQHRVEDRFRAVAVYPPPDESCAYAETVFRAQMLRFDFRFDEIIRSLNGASSGDALLEAILIFGEVGGSDSIPDSQAADFRKRIDSLRQHGSVDVKVDQCLVHAMSLRPEIDGFPEYIATIGEHLARLEEHPNSVTYYRLALGYRAAGRYDDALRAIRNALRLPPIDNLVVQQYLFEYETIKTLLAFDRSIQKQMDRVQSELLILQEETETLVEEELRRGLTANFQILAVFLTFAGFLGTAGVTLVRLVDGGVTWQRATLTLTLITVFTAVLFTLARLANEVRFSRTSRRKRDD